MKLAPSRSTLGFYGRSFCLATGLSFFGSALAAEIPWCNPGGQYLIFPLSLLGGALWCLVRALTGTTPENADTPWRQTLDYAFGFAILWSIVDIFGHCRTVTAAYLLGIGQLALVLSLVYPLFRFLTHWLLSRHDR